jgi:RNA polymerase Rpb2, domain 4
MHTRTDTLTHTHTHTHVQGMVGEFVSVYLHSVQRAVYIASDGGRVCRPLLVVQGGRTLLTEKHMAQLASGVRGLKVGWLVDDSFAYCAVCVCAIICSTSCVRSFDSRHPFLMDGRCLWWRRAHTPRRHGTWHMAELASGGRGLKVCMFSKKDTCTQARTYLKVSEL